MGEALWAVKHRPTTWEQVVGQPSIVSSLRDNNLQHLILHSPHCGVGKTTIAHILAKEHDCILHTYNASSKRTRGIEFVEEELLPLSRSGNFNQIFLLDEADQLTPAAQSALKGVIENACGYFILTCNDLSKIDTALKSRCTTFTFNPITENEMILRLTVIAEKENVMYQGNHIPMIARAHEGDLRSAINALQVYDGLYEHDCVRQQKWLDKLNRSRFDNETFLSHCFKEQDFELALSFANDKGGKPQDFVREVFRYAINSTAQVKSKVKVIDAAVVAERDFISGVDESIALTNFVRTLASA